MTVSLDCPFLIVHSVFSSVYLSCVLRTQCCQCLWVVHSWLPARCSLILIVLCFVYSILTVSLDCPFLIVNSVFFNVYLSCVLRTHCWQCLWIVHSWWSPLFSLMFIYPVSCVLNADSAYGLSIRFSQTFICLVSCLLNVDSAFGLSILDYPLGLFNVNLSCHRRTQCCQCLWIVHS